MVGRLQDLQIASCVHLCINIMDVLYTEQSRRERDKKFKQYQVTLHKIPGILGDGQDNIRVPGFESTYAFVRLGSDGEQEVDKVLNLRVPFIYGQAVWVGYDVLQPKVFQVLSQRQQELIDSGEGHYPNVPEHGASHNWAAGVDGTGGYDLVYPSFEQVTDLSVRPAADLGPFWVRLYEGQMPRKNGFVFISAANGNTVTLNLAGDVPIAQSFAVLLYIDRDGDLQRKLSDAVPTAALNIEMVPKPPTSGDFPVAWVRLYAGQTLLSYTYDNQDVQQIRWPQYNMAGGDQASRNNRKLIEMGW